MPTKTIALLVLFSTSVCFGQSIEVKPRIIQLTAPATEDIVLADLDIQAVNGGNISYGYSWSYGNANAALIDYLSNDRIRKQLEFTDDQADDFKALKKEYGKAFSEMYAKFPELKDKDLPSKARQELNRRVHLAGQKIREEFSEKLKETLVPRQVSMITTLRFRQIVQSYGLTHALTKNPFAKELKTSEDQKKEIEKIRKDTQAAINKKIAEMKAEAKKEMLKVLDAKQRQKLKELEGEQKLINSRL